jgi:hypothetical protein
MKGGFFDTRCFTINITSTAVPSGGGKVFDVTVTLSDPGQAWECGPAGLCTGTCLSGLLSCCAGEADCCLESGCDTGS